MWLDNRYTCGVFPFLSCSPLFWSSQIYIFILISSYGYGVGHYPKLIVGSTYDQSKHSPTLTPSILDFWWWSRQLSTIGLNHIIIIMNALISSQTLCKIRHQEDAHKKLGGVEILSLFIYYVFPSYDESWVTCNIWCAGNYLLFLSLLRDSSLENTKYTSAFL